MGKRSLCIVALLTGMLWGIAAPATGMDDLQQHPGCRYCGMNRESFSYSRMLLEYEDGSQVGTCSLNCAAIDYVRDPDKTPQSIRVGDYKTRKLIDAEKAAWVIGGDERGVMTQRAKWAFEEQEDAASFMREHGGVLASFDDVMKASFEDMYADMKQTWSYRTAARPCCARARTDAAGRE